MQKEATNIINLHAARDRRNAFAIPCPPPGSLIYSRTWPSRWLNYPRIIGPSRRLWIWF
jgi:hypothetical protein